MAEIRMPKLSDTMTEGTVVKWHKNIGDPVEVGDLLAEIETDKATMEWESPEEGVLHEIRIKEGKTIAVGELLAIVLGEGEAPPKDAAAPKKAPKPEEIPTDKQAIKHEPPAGAPAEPKAGPATEPTGQRVKVSPLARKIAQAKGINLSKVTGTGPGGRIVKADVEAGTAAPGGSAPVEAVAPPVTEAGDSERIPLTGMRRLIAERLVQSKTQIPHFYLNVELDASGLLSIRKQLNDAVGDENEKLTINDLVLKAVVLSVKDSPGVNAAWGGDAIIRYRKVHLSVAVSVEDGLVTPVIRDAGSKTLRQLSASMKDLALRARSKKLKPDEFQGGTITVSSLGSFGIDSFQAIINPPQAVILSIGAIVAKPVVGAGGAIVAGQRMNIGLSGDHRVVDGALGAQYLSSIRKYLETPALMLM